MLATHVTTHSHEANYYDVSLLAQDGEDIAYITLHVAQLSHMPLSVYDISITYNGTFVSFRQLCVMLHVLKDHLEKGELRYADSQIVWSPYARSAI